MVRCMFEMYSEMYAEMYLEMSVETTNQYRVEVISFCGTHDLVVYLRLFSQVSWHSVSGRGVYFLCVYII